MKNMDCSMVYAISDFRELELQVLLETRGDRREVVAIRYVF